LGRPSDEPQPAWESGGAADAPAGGAGPQQISVAEIDSTPFQPRRDFDDAALGELAESVKEHGLLQPLVARRHGNRYQLIAGERRLRAAVKAGLSHVPMQVREADDRQMAELAIVENLQRRDLHALEKAASFQDYLGRYGCTQEELAGRLKIDRSTLTNLIRLLELPRAVQDTLRRGAITPGHARALLPLGDEHEQLAFCRRIEDESLSVRSTEQMVQELIHEADAEPLSISDDATDTTPARARRVRTEHVATLERELRAALGTKADVKQGSKGKGKIVIHFSSNDEFQRLWEHLCGQAAHSQAG